MQVQAIALSYPHEQGVHPKAPFIGDTQFIESTLGMMSESNMEACVSFLPVLQARHYSRDELAQLAEDQVRSLVELQHRVEQ